MLLLLANRVYCPTDRASPTQRALQQSDVGELETMLRLRRVERIHLECLYIARFDLHE